MPFYQSAVEDRVEYELTFNGYGRAIKAVAEKKSSYKIENICLEYDIVTQPELPRLIRNQYARCLAIHYDRVLRHRKITANKRDTLWNVNFNVPARSMKGILMMFEDSSSGEAGAAFARYTETFYNPQISKVEVTIEGVPNQLCSHGRPSEGPKNLSLFHCICSFFRQYAMSREISTRCFCVCSYKPSVTPQPPGS